MLTARKSSRISNEKLENKRAKIVESTRITTRSKSIEQVKEIPVEIPRTPLRRSPRQSPENSPVKKETVKEEKDEKENKPAEVTVSNVPSNNTEDPFNVAKRAFHRSGNFKIVGRIEEKAELTSFWYDHVESGKGASIYISGNPGTGKTALVDELLPELMGNSRDKKVLKINCMMLKDPLKAFKEIAQAVKLKFVDKNPFIILNSLENYFCNETRETFIIVIDEIDQIGMKDPELLCKLLAMPYLPNAKVCVFGIANSMDLTERFLPRLKLLNCEPAVLHFPQYTVSDITLILSDRLERINSASLGRTFIDKPAIELTSRKVASTGDLRRALDILRQAIDLAEDEYKLSTSITNTTGALVKLSHVVKIMEKFGSSQSGPLVLLKSLNLHQKVILSAIVGFPQDSKGSVLTIQKLYEEYCSGASRPPKLYDSVTRSEFIDLISNLESMSLIGKSSTDSSATTTTTAITDLWKLKVYLLVPNELVKTMISQELPTIKALFGL